ncbi:MAG: prepilin-type N-terminal cleavage/methylation domain-containing protein [Clostridium sp.]
MNKLKKRRKGFTLIEMVVVIAIVVIIAAIAIPQALKAINKSKASTDFANARTYAGQIMSRAANNDITLGATTASDVALVKDSVTELSGTKATGLIGVEISDVKLKSGDKFYALYTTDKNGNDKVSIAIGSTTKLPTVDKTSGILSGEVYPNVDSKSEYAKYVTSTGQTE